MLLQLFMWGPKWHCSFALPYPVQTRIYLPGQKKESFPSFSFLVHAFQAISSTEKLLGLFVQYLSICLILDQNYYFWSASFLDTPSVILSSLVFAAFCNVQL